MENAQQISFKTDPSFTQSRHYIRQKNGYIWIYMYVFELLLSFLFSTTIILIAGAVSNHIIETIVFLTGFILPRSFSGGYHTLTYSFCTIVTFIVYGTTMSLSHYLLVNHIAFLVLLILGIIILSVLAPIKNPNKALSEDKIMRLQFYLVLYLLFTSYYIPRLCQPIIYLVPPTAAPLF